MTTTAFIVPEAERYGTLGSELIMEQIQELTIKGDLLYRYSVHF